jgi:Susd and RagB outer membrane lipoprotein
MKENIKINIGIFLALATAAMPGCTKHFEDYNTNPAALTTAQSASIIATALGPIEQNINTQYQVAQNLSADAFCGYMMTSTPFNNVNYDMVDNYNSTGFNNYYTDVMAPISRSMAAIGLRTSAPDEWAVALIVQVFAMHKVTDRFGPIPYSKAGVSLTNVPYDSQQDVYNEFFAQLDTATASLQAYIAAHPGNKPLGSGDLIYGGDYTLWLKLANSLRLRLAMRIVKADPQTAQTQGEKALSAPGGLLSLPSDSAFIQQSGGRSNDVWVVTASYNDNRMGADLGTYLTGFNDPRLPVYAAPATDPLVAGLYTGIRLGSTVTKDASVPNGHLDYASLNTTNTFTQTAPQVLMTAPEVFFLKAEAALRGWAGAGDAQADYEAGINASMQQWHVQPGNYITDATSTETAYTDPKNSANSSPALSTITIAWDPAATNEQKLERIITQKWIALFPNGQEAWAEFRRTGYPELFSVVNNLSGGSISTQVQIRRLPYPTSEYNTNGAAVQAAVQTLGGPDNGGTRLWWDVDKGNF